MSKGRAEHIAVIERIDNLLDSLEKGRSVTDQDILDLSRQLEKTMPGTNCASAARHLLSYIGAFLFFRPHLVSELISIPLKPIYILGADDSDQVLNWIEYDLNHESSTVTQYRYNGHARIYLETRLRNERDVIDKSLASMRDENAINEIE